MVDKLKMILSSLKFTQSKDPYQLHADFMAETTNKPMGQIHEHVEHSLRIRLGKQFYEAHIVIGALAQLSRKNPIDMMENFSKSDELRVLYRDAMKTVKKSLDAVDVKPSFRI